MPFWQRLEQFSNPPKFQAAMLAEHDIVTTPAQIGLPAMVMVGTADAARACLAREGDLTSNAPFFSLGDLLDFSASTINEEPGHRRFREMMRPAFDAAAVSSEAFLGGVVARVIGASLEGAAEEGRVVPGYALMRRMTFEIIMNAMMGRDYTEAEFDRLHALFIDFTGGMMSWPQLDVPFTAYGRGMAARRALLEIFDRDIAAARAAAAAGRPVDGQLGVMVTARDEEGNGMGDRQIRELLLGLLFAGHDTTSTSLTGLIATLQDHPDVVAQLRAEQAAVAARHGPAITAAAMKEMTYADAVIRESLRLTPVTNELFRTAARDFEMNGRVVPKGSVISLPLATISACDPRWAGETGDMAPGVFNPARMLAPEGQAAGDQMPFGFGKRRCLGVHLALAEMKAFLAIWARRYDITADTATEWGYSVGRYPKNGLPMRVAVRGAAAR